jgi:urea transport system ATP-binding protein
MLEVKNIHQYYGGSHILRDVSLTAVQGQVTVLLGRNGVGKTTLLKSLMGVVPIKSGSVVLDGKELSNAKPYERASAGIGYVPQGREIFARLTVEDNLRMGLATQPGGPPFQLSCSSCFRCSSKCFTVGVVTCRVGSSSSSPLPVRWLPSRVY